MPRNPLFFAVLCLSLCGSPWLARGEAPIPKEANQPETIDNSDLSEVLYTSEFLQVAPIDPIPEKILQFEKNNARFLYISKRNLPFVFLMGSLAPGYEMSLNNQWVVLKPGRRFEQRLSIPLEPGFVELKLFAPDRSFRVYRIINLWIKMPPSIKARIKEGDTIFERSAGYNLALKQAGFVQLYSGDSPVSTVDLDSLRHAEHTFRLFSPPNVDATYDSWALTLKNEDGQKVGELKRIGNPPPFIEWHEVGTPVREAGNYQYALTLTQDGKDLPGTTNTFEAVQGLSLLGHSYLPVVAVEPKAEFGYFYLSDATDFRTGNAYLGGDVGFAFADRFLLRGLGLMSLHTLDSTSFFTFTRASAGTRFRGNGESGFLGSPYLYKIDALLTFSGMTVREGAPSSRYSHLGVLIDAELAISGVHYVTPSAEFAVKPNFDQMRLSVGMGYAFFVRPWSMKVGLGFNYDTLLRSVSTPQAKFSLFRSHLSLGFFL